MSVVSIEEEIQADAPAVLRRPAEARMVRRKRPWLTALRIVVPIVAALYFLLPVYWMVISSFKLPGEYMHRPTIWIPEEPVLNHYRMAYEDKGRTRPHNSS